MAGEIIISFPARTAFFSPDRNTQAEICGPARFPPSPGPAAAGLVLGVPGVYCACCGLYQEARSFCRNLPPVAEYKCRSTTAHTRSTDRFRC